MIFEITGKIKPYVRMTQRSKHADPQAQQYLISKEAIGWQFREAMKERQSSPADRIPLRVDIFFTVPNRKNTCDIDNLIKAIFDAGNGIVWLDDRWIDTVTATRKIGNEYLTIVKVNYEPTT